MEAQIIGVLSNHDKLKKLASWYDVDFKKVAIHKNTKEIDMATMMSTVDAFQPDVIVLARYMQIIPKAMIIHLPVHLVLLSQLCKLLLERSK
jgi:formyltetrahydrofolate deformylase